MDKVTIILIRRYDGKSDMFMCLLNQIKGNILKWRCSKMFLWYSGICRSDSEKPALVVLVFRAKSNQNYIHYMLIIRWYHDKR